MKLSVLPVLNSLEFGRQVSRYALIFVSAFFRQRTSLACEFFDPTGSVRSAGDSWCKSPVVTQMFEMFAEAENQRVAAKQSKPLSPLFFSFVSKIAELRQICVTGRGVNPTFCYSNRIPK